MNILFRVDSSSKIGLGHLMRCLVLAGQYSNDNIIFATQNLSNNANQKITKNNYQLITLTSNTQKELMSAVIDNAIDMLVLDHYDIDHHFEKNIKEKTGVKILSFDDTYQKHYCDILLNHNVYAKDEDYKNLVPDFCELRCGQKYTLIRDEFKQIKPKKRTINKKNPIVFVAMGGTDSQNVNLSVLKVLVQFSNLTANLATTSANKNTNELKEFAKHHNNINIYIDYNIAKLMNNSDFAIITPSVIVYEVMHLNLPFIAIKTGDNQHYICQYLKKIKHPVLDKYDKNMFKNMIKEKLHE